MNSLLAILLVADSTEERQFVLSYPANPQRPLADSYHSSDSPVKSSLPRKDQDDRENETTQHNDDATEEDSRLPPNASRLQKQLASSGTSSNNSSETAVGDKQNGSKEGHNAFAGRFSIFDMELGFLADMLTPKQPLCDKRFQLTMDDLTFVGHPVSLDTTTRRHVRQSPTTTAAAADKQPKSSSLLRQETDDKSVDDISKRIAIATHDSDTSSAHMTLFHVVFVTSPPDLELNAQTDALYFHAARRYAAALRYEQLRCGYVREQIEKIVAIKDEGANKGTPYDVVMQNILRESSLARDIKEIYTALSTGNIAHIIINDFIDLSLQIPTFGYGGSHEAIESSDEVTVAPAKTHDFYYASLMHIYGMSGYDEYDNYPIIFPYHTLLLLEDPEEVLKNMPLDASPTLVQLVQILTPTQSLQELHLLLDCSLAQIYRLAAHLIYWRKAKLIHTIHARNIYVVSPQAKLDDLASMDADFRMHIPNLDLAKLLSQLSIAKPLHMIAPKELRNQYLEAITYLVRKDIVVQLHMFLVLILPSPCQDSSVVDEEDITSNSRRSSSLVPPPLLSSSSAAATVSASPPSDTMSSSPGQSSFLEQRNLLKRLGQEKVPKEIAELFERLTPYMDGKHSIEEIMYREGVSRRQLSLVLKYYRDNIVTVYHY